jgi:hypothetical protein
VAKERRPLTAQEVVDMHSYCITPGDVRRSTFGNLYIPKSLDPVCEHPEHGWCGHRSPSEVELLGINAHLTSNEDAEHYAKPENRKLVGTPVKRKLVHKPKRYFCQKCNLYHVEGDPNLPLKTVGTGYDKHIEFRRKRGRPMGWRKKK